MEHTTPEHLHNDNVVFHVHGVTKIYPMGEVEVRALRGVDLSRTLSLLGQARPEWLVLAAVIAWFFVVGACRRKAGGPAA